MAPNSLFDALCIAHSVADILSRAASIQARQSSALLQRTSRNPKFYDELPPFSPADASNTFQTEAAQSNVEPTGASLTPETLRPVGSLSIKYQPSKPSHPIRPSPHPKPVIITSQPTPINGFKLLPPQLKPSTPPVTTSPITPNPKPSQPTNPSPPLKPVIIEPDLGLLSTDVGP